MRRCYISYTVCVGSADARCAHEAARSALTQTAKSTGSPPTLLQRAERRIRPPAAHKALPARAEREFLQCVVARGGAPRPARGAHFRRARARCQAAVPRGRRQTGAHLRGGVSRGPATAGFWASLDNARRAASPLPQATRRVPWKGKATRGFEPQGQGSSANARRPRAGQRRCGRWASRPYRFCGMQQRKRKKERGLVRPAVGRRPGAGHASGGRDRGSRRPQAAARRPDAGGAAAGAEAGAVS